MFQIMHCVILHRAQDTLKELQDFISDTENTICQDGNNKSHDAAASEPHEEPPSKRVKLEPSASGDAEDAAVGKQKDEEPCVCVVCLGILQGLCDVTQAVKVCVCACVC